MILNCNKSHFHFQRKTKNSHEVPIDPAVPCILYIWCSVHTEYKRQSVYSIVYTLNPYVYIVLWRYIIVMHTYSFNCKSSNIGRGMINDVKCSKVVQKITLKMVQNVNPLVLLRTETICAFETETSYQHIGKHFTFWVPCSFARNKLKNSLTSYVEKFTFYHIQLNCTFQ